MYKKGKMKKLLLLLIVFTIGCSKEDYCGIVTGGGFDEFYNSYYLRVDGKRELVDMKTYDSFYIGDAICMEFSR